MDNLRVDSQYLVRTLSDLVKINSINPSLSTGGAGESEIADYVADNLRQLGLRVETHEPQPGRISVVGKLKGRGGGRSLMLNAHTDTVGVEGMKAPFSPHIRAGKLYGRGAYDMKGSLAACMAAVKALVGEGVELGGDLLVAAVADEEYESIGTADLVQRYSVDGAIVTEPTQMKICLAHKGFSWLEVETVGRAAHGSRFEEGIDANLMMGRFLFELEALIQELTRRERHALIGPPSMHVSKIQGGTELSMYAAACTALIERRTLPSESEEQVVAEIQAIIDRLSGADPKFKAGVESFFVREPFEVSPDAEIVHVIETAAKNVLGDIPPYTGETYWMDSALLSGVGIETVVIGPVGGGAHAHQEWVDLESLSQLAKLLAQAALIYCK
ncbi:MAG: ArgE/DapE family deacylase [Anaerolineales bacterium]|jgi:acetylornithine deacetylase